jgi:hypothetical protein
MPERSNEEIGLRAIRLRGVLQSDLEYNSARILRGDSNVCSKADMAIQRECIALLNEIIGNE